MAERDDFNGFSGPGGKPTKAECCLIEFGALGEVSECKEFSGPQRLVSSALIAALATGEFQHSRWQNWCLHVNGIKLHGAHINDCLVLENRQIAAPLKFFNCSFANGLDLDDVTVEGDLFVRNCRISGECRLASASISGQICVDKSEFSNPGDQAITAFGAKALYWSMDEVVVHGEVDIDSVELTGQFSANGAKFDNPDGSAIVAHRIVAAGWFMDGAEVTGTLQLAEARFTGQFSCVGTRFKGTEGQAIIAYGISAGSCIFDGATLDGLLDVTGAEFSGQFSANEAVFSNTRANTSANTSGCAVMAYNLRALSWFMNNTQIKGLVHIGSSHITGPFNAWGTTFDGMGGRAIQAHYATIDGGVFLKPGVGKKGTQNVTVSGDLNFSFARIEKVFDLSKIRITANSTRAISLRGATIIGEANFDEAQISGHVLADSLRVEGRLSFQGAKLGRSGNSGSQDIADAPPQEADDGSDRQLQDRFKNYALVLREANISGRLVMPNVCPDGIVDLSRARCDILEDFAGGWAPPLAAGETTGKDRKHFDKKPDDGDEVCSIDVQHYVLDGLEYSYLEHPSGEVENVGKIADQRIRWLAGQSRGDLNDHFNPQPWRQVTRVLNAMGYSEEAQRISIQRRVRQRRAKDTPRFQRLVSWMLHFLADYGFNPWKTIAISVVIILGCSMVYWGGINACAGANKKCAGQPVFLQVEFDNFDTKTTREDVYPPFNAIIYSFDIFVPVLEFGEDAYWRANTKAVLKRSQPLFPAMGEKPFPENLPVGWILYAVVILERILGAILLAITITGFTGMLTRDDS